MRRWCSGNITDFQSVAAGSIPARRTWQVLWNELSLTCAGYGTRKGQPAKFMDHIGVSGKINMWDFVQLVIIFLMSPLYLLAEYVTSKTQPTEYSPISSLLFIMVGLWFVLAFFVVLGIAIWWACNHFVYVG